MRLLRRNMLVLTLLVCVFSSIISCSIPLSSRTSRRQIVEDEVASTKKLNFNYGVDKNINSPIPAPRTTEGLPNMKLSSYPTPNLLNTADNRRANKKGRRAANSISVPYLENRSLNELSLSDILIAADVEGGLHAVDRRNGHIIWSIEPENFQPLIEIQEPSRLETYETLIIEPFGDGNIYYFNAHQGLQKLPLSIRQLVSTSPLHLKTNIVVNDSGRIVEDEKVYTGSMRTIMYTINMLNGEIISAFGPGSKNGYFGSQSVDCSPEEKIKLQECENMIVIGKTIFELGIHSYDGASYNVTYSTWQQNVLDVPLALQNTFSKDGMCIAPFRDKSLLASDLDFRIARWVSPTFPGIIVGLFDVFNDLRTNENILVPHPFNPGDHESISSNKVYLDQTSNLSWFALSSQNFPSLVESAPVSRYASSDRWRVSSIFEDETLFKNAIMGVHQIYNNEYDHLYENYEKTNSLDTTHKYPPLMIDSSVDTTDLHQNNEMNSLKEYMSPEDLEAYRKKIHEQISRELDEKNQNSLLLKFGSLVYRIIETGVFLLLFLIFCAILQRFKILPPLYVLLSKIGFMPEKEIPIVESKSLNCPSSSENVTKPFDMKSGKQVVFEGDVNDGSLKSEKDNDDADEDDEKSLDLTTEKKKRKRGSRGGKKGRKSRIANIPNFEQSLKNLVVSEKILGYGSSGTVVFQGSFQGRPVAVKRMLIDFCDIALMEIKLLTESDDHPNVIRYYCSETTDRFLYIALELCNLNLQDLVESKNVSDENLKLQKEYNPISLLRQIASGVAYLHSLKIIHRDLKPQNILVSTSSRFTADQQTGAENLRILISDFGLCKKLDSGQSSFRTNLNNPSGTSGWRAPELLEESNNLQCQVETEHSSSRHTVVSSDSFYDPFTKRRLTRSIDIFSMGCVFYYILSKGKHPFGDKYSRESNIIRGIFSLDEMKCLHDRSLIAEATDLISQMIDHDPLKRPTAMKVLRHPLFWPKSKKLEFLLKVSDRLEIENKDPPSALLMKFDAGSDFVIPSGDWTVKFDKTFMDNLERYRKYHSSKLMDLLRALRNKYHHFMDLPEDIAELMGPVPDGFYDYFTKRFPNLLIGVYMIVKENLSDDQILREFLYS
ncbi:BBT_HP_G0014210.mRNA.1.CDS.1 [Saccharomyces cerevisiae]|nr:BBT_HP_G0038010.mRNA.1.CDS.1 [Saccharomyces cerevisiae]CAI4997863.1 BBT_HP_G0078080.mRNA.1.CDS.1 [Saccharomyces cerevisiae]CAI5207127.1 BBT_HP_G0012060.mRNA.1.CDS.1 [Saccharomyces cerevisiae]CAI5208196.1 BBT_HP_G0014210.mRNA.1.CDS.1 [Saccharomyces cerevisiae]CAI6535708.1 BBT_HP_G0038010.mRNA.1.CDS.1 [Saccharomyces cerevisiae]